MRVRLRRGGTIQPPTRSQTFQARRFPIAAATISLRQETTAREIPIGFWSSRQHQVANADPNSYRYIHAYSNGDSYCDSYTQANAYCQAECNAEATSTPAPRLVGPDAY